MTPRERVIAAFDHRRPDKLPRYDVFFQSFIDLWRKRKGMPEEADIYAAYPVDIPRILANQGGPFWRDQVTSETGADIYYVRDSWGRLRKHRHSQSHFEVIETAVNDATDLDRMVFGDPHEMVEKDEDRRSFDNMLNDPRFAPVSGVMGLYHACTWLRGDVPFMMDLADDTGFSRALIDKLAVFLAELGKYMLARTNTTDTAIWVYDDFGVSHGPLISPETFASCFLEPYRRMFSLWKSKGVRHIYLHHDVMSEACYPIIDMFVDAGLTGVQGVYPTAGLTLPSFKKRYGNKLGVIGGMCNTRTLPFGSRREIEREAAAIREVAQDGGVVIGSHSIEGYIPVEHYDWYWGETERPL